METLFLSNSTLTSSGSSPPSCIVVAIFRIVNNLRNDLKHNETGNLVQTTLLTSLEPCLAMICSSMPMCRRFLSLPRPWWSRWTPRSLCVRSARARDAADRYPRAATASVDGAFVTETPTPLRWKMRVFPLLNAGRETAA
ncbi:hypothetical protein PspLS_09616 [Pyricularia sp. CBS 133598]|nr:hypothetical protein PspLS_09616 [Pyricularia sp. CBS 133598]